MEVTVVVAGWLAHPFGDQGERMPTDRGADDRYDVP
jgi:hypothetical protein